MVQKVPVKVTLLVSMLMFATTALLYSAGSKEKTAVASVNGVLIPESYLDREVKRFEEQALGQGQPLDDITRQRLNRQALDTLINIELLYQESQRRGFEITEDRIDEQVAGLREQFGGEEGYAAALEQIGINDEELRTEFRRQLAIQDMIDTDLAPAVSVSERESMEFYSNNADYFLVPEQVRASHILILLSQDAGEEEKNEAFSRMEEIKERIEAGEDFAELAALYSEDSSSANGGDLGYFRREQMVEPFADAAFALEIGQVSEVVTTQFGLHLIRVTDRMEESLVPYEQVQMQIIEYLRREKVMRAVEELAASLRTRAEIEEYTLPEE